MQVRGGDSLQFSLPIRHNHLKALIVETGGLSRDTVAQNCQMNLPVLEHLELWFGSEHYGGDCWVEDLNQILFEEKFTNLNYLWLRNSQFTDEIVSVIVVSPIIDSICVLDLSMGTLSDAGAEELLNCSAINNLDILNVSEKIHNRAIGLLHKVGIKGKQALLDYDPWLVLTTFQDWEDYYYDGINDPIGQAYCLCAENYVNSKNKLLRLLKDPKDE